MTGLVQRTRRLKRTSTSLRPSPSFAKSDSLRPRRQQTTTAGSSHNDNKLIDAIKELTAQKSDVTQVLTIESFIERSKHNEII